jgi:Homeodomain-like domain-containing protein
VDGDLLEMSAKERERAHVIRRVSERQMRQARGAELLGICVRQVKRLVLAYRRFGDRGLVCGRRGKPSNNRLAAETVARMERALRERYADFGATLAAEKLCEHEGLAVSIETVRQTQIRLALWQPKRRRQKRVYQARERRDRFGELVQIDGSVHDWLEGRGPRMTLIVFIDDATGRLTALRFAPAETTRVYVEALRDHVLAHGVPLAFYSDRHGIFRVNAKEVETGDGLTVFNRVTERLGITQICATTPQAKGRVERANRTLQDRLIKEMRLAGIRDMAAGQAFLPTFMARHNARFAVAPKRQEDAHKPWEKGTEALDAALATHEPRTLSKALTFSAGRAIHCIKTMGAGVALRGAKVTVRHYLDGRMDVLFKDRILPYTTVRMLPRASQIEDDKTIDASLDEIIGRNNRCAPSPGSVDGSGYGGPDPTTAPAQTPITTHHPSTRRGDIST